MISIDIIIKLSLLFYLVSASDVLERREQKKNGYECGDTFITDQVVQDTLKIALSELGKEKILPYTGQLYSRAMDYMTWPIYLEGSYLRQSDQVHPNLWSKATYQIVFEREGKLIDVIMRMANYEFAKCGKIGSALLETSEYNIEGSNGYECGPKFIPDKSIEESVTVASSYLGNGYLYPMLYKGTLYGTDPDFMIWPIYFRGSVIHRYPNKSSGPYFIVIDSTGQFKDVIVKSSKGDYIKCIRTRKVPPAPVDDVFGNLFAKPPRSGYICNDIFFDDKDLQVASQAALKFQTSNKAKKYPQIYRGPPFNSACFLWPLREDGQSYRRGGMHPYRLVLTLDFKIICVAIQGAKKLVQCDKRTISGGRQDKDHTSYRCDSDVFSHDELVPVANIACEKRKLYFKQSYPAPYDGLKFDVEGPYLIYPLSKNKMFAFRPGRHRLVINAMCKIAGVLTMSLETRELVKCIVEKSINSNAKI